MHYRGYSFRYLLPRCGYDALLGAPVSDNLLFRSVFEGCHMATTETRHDSCHDEVVLVRWMLVCVD